MAAHLLQFRAEETNEANAQLDQLHVAIDHKVPGESLAEGGRANVLAECRRLRLERAQRLPVHVGELGTCRAARRPAAVIGRRGLSLLLISGCHRVLEANQGPRFAHRQGVVDDHFLHDGQREAEMVAEGRFGLELVDGDADRDPDAE